MKLSTSLAGRGLVTSIGTVSLLNTVECEAVFVPVPATFTALKVYDYKTGIIIEGNGLDFDTAVGHPITWQVVLENTHTLAPLFFSDLVLPKGFSKISEFPRRLEPGQKFVFQIQLDAQAVGVYEGLLSFKVGREKVGYPLIGVVYDTCPEANQRRVLFVKKGAETGNGGGCSWNSPFKDLQPTLLAIANNKYPKAQEIWVTSGTYKPTQDTDRTASFRLINGVSIYGGFLGTEEKRQDRNEHQYVCPAPTILSGDIGLEGDASDNSYHVVVAHGVSSSTGIYDVMITGGNANATKHKTYKNWTNTL
ncbi:conserved hypothetical protein [Beggiatoa sp. SS]|nr:conserved hypothetical protein [Beggiatoa sp. SS]